jgi:hypothetical protein
MGRCLTSTQPRSAPGRTTTTAAWDAVVSRRGARKAWLYHLPSLLLPGRSCRRRTSFFTMRVGSGIDHGANHSPDDSTNSCSCNLLLLISLGALVVVGQPFHEPTPSSATQQGDRHQSNDSHWLDTALRRPPQANRTQGVECPLFRPLNAASDCEKGLRHSALWFTPNRALPAL